MADRGWLRVVNHDNVVALVEEPGAFLVHLQVYALLRLLEVVVTALQGVVKRLGYGEELGLTVDQAPFG